MSAAATLQWRVNGKKIERNVSLRNGELILSEYYLQSLLPPSLKFQGLVANIVLNNGISTVDVTPRWDHEGHALYLIDSSLSSCYSILHSDDCVYVTDSYESPDQDDMEDFQRSTPDCSNTVPVSVDTPSNGTGSLKDAEVLQKSEDIEVNVQLDDELSQCERSIVSFIEQSARAGKLKKLLALTSTPLKVREIPTNYNGSLSFELPPSNGERRMLGMEQKYDGHLWTRPSQTNMAIECTVRLSYCLGDLKCYRVTCPYYLNEKKYNDIFFHGHLDKQVCAGYPTCDDHSKITCHYCQKIATCTAVCTCMIYYVLPIDPLMTRLVIHIGDHTHSVKQGTNRANIEKVRNIVSTVLKIDKGGPRKIQMMVAREMLFQSLTKEDETETSEMDLNHFLDEMMPLVQNKGFKGIVTQERDKQDHVIGDGYDNILLLQKRCVFPFFHGSRFPGQSDLKEKCYLFKMSTKGPASGVDLVNRMRRTGNGDLRNAWVHFDHTHRIDGWATMSCSVYDPNLRALQVIAICECKEEDVESQVLFWKSLNAVMDRCGLQPPDFAGFMSDEAGANWLAIRTVYNGGPHNVMVGRERSCLFHWEQSLHKHTKKLLPKDKQMQHIELCEAWRLQKTTQSVAKHASIVRSFWVQNVEPANTKALEKWFAWWEQRIAHWGGVETHLESSPWERAQIPSINLSESVHASWLAGVGGKRKISLYDACVSDVLNAYIQCAKRLGYTTGRYLGSGPSVDHLLGRASSRKSPNPAFVAKSLQSAVAGTPLYEEPIMLGDRESVQRKKKRGPSTTSSHKPGYVMESRQRKIKGRPRSIQFEDEKIEEICILDEEENEEVQINNLGKEERGHDWGSSVLVQEVEVAREDWALRRMPPHCIRKCFGLYGRKYCNNKLQSRDVGLIAPCFWSERSYTDGVVSQWIWFCNHDVKHTAAVQKQIRVVPEVPCLWHVAKGTNISKEELSSLQQAGFKLACRAMPQNRSSNINLSCGLEGSSGRKHKWRHGISKQAHKRIESAATMNASFLEEKVILDRQHIMFRILTESSYEVHIKEEPTCTCPDFKKRESVQKAFLACKHMYFVYLYILGLQPKEHIVIHQPALTLADLAFVLGQERKLHPLV